MSLEARVRANVQRVVALLDGADGGRPIPGMEWTVGEAGAHLVTGFRDYTKLFEGEAFDAGVGVDDTAEENARMLEAYTVRDPAVLAADLPGAAEALLAAYAAGPPDRPLDWWAGTKVSAHDMLAINLGELVIHGWDIAQGLGKPWAIDREDAIAVMLGSLAIAPLYVDREKAAGMNGVLRMKARGGPTIGLTFKDGVLTVGDAPAKADCTVSADPAAFLLSSYGRGSKWMPILTGKVVAYGRKPLFALKFQGALKTP